MAPLGQAHRSAQHHHRPVVALMPRAQSRREYLAIHARQLAIQQDLPILRKHSRSLLLLLEQTRGAAVDHHVHRPPRMGAQVLINGIWY
jgi:hypothetical protein